MTGQENTYSFQYDGLSRLTNTQQYVEDIRNDLFAERSISYDRNGNIKYLTRTDSGAVADSLSYSYNGNQLATLLGSTIGTYSYDDNGNMTHDGANNLDLTYNSLNLIKNVAINDTHWLIIPILQIERNFRRRMPRATDWFTQVL